MKRLIFVLLLSFSTQSNAGFVADEATWVLFHKNGGDVYLHDPYQIEYFPNGDVEILITRLKEGEKSLSHNPERMRFECKTKNKLHSFMLQSDGSWLKAGEYPIKNGTLNETWLRISCGLKNSDVNMAYIATSVSDQVPPQTSVFYWEKDKIYPSKIEGKTVVKYYVWNWSSNSIASGFTVIDCKTKESYDAVSPDSLPEKVDPSAPRSSVRGFLISKACSIK